MFRVAFASCCNWAIRKRQRAWDRLARKDPDLLILLGDNIYSRDDDYLHEPPIRRRSGRRHGLRLRYEEQFSVRSFRNLIDAVPYLATWDDHDLGPNNALGREDARGYRATSRALFLEHFRPKPRGMGRLNRVRGEIYHSYVAQGVRFIVLDCRYYRASPRTGSANELLGRRQANWLFARLEEARTGPYRATVVCVGPTFLDSLAGERLADYPAFDEAFNDVFSQCPTPIVLSGDIHRNKITPHEGFIELTSSGIAQAAKAADGTRTGIKKGNYGLLTFGPDAARVALYREIPGGEEIQFRRRIPYLSAL